MGIRLANCVAAVVDRDISLKARIVSRFTAFPGACDCEVKERYKVTENRAMAHVSHKKKGTGEIEGHGDEC